MGRKKKQHWLIKGIKGLFKGIWYIIRGIVLGTIWVFKKIYLCIQFLISKLKRDEIKNEESIKTNKNNKLKHDKHTIDNKNNKHNKHNIPKKQINHITSKEKDFKHFQTDIHKNSLLMVILGKRGSGKTALAHSLAEEMASYQKKNMATFNEPKPIHNLPNYTEVNEIPNNTIIILDEAGINFSSRNAMAKQNKDILNELRISRHRGISTIIITQDSGSIDVGFLRLADYLIMKRISQSMFDFERPALKKRLQKGYNHLNELKDDKSALYVLSDDFTGLCNHSLPSYWNDKVSKNYGQ